MIPALLLALLAQDGWIDPAWTHRRQVTLTSSGDEPIAAGRQVKLDVDATALGLTDKCVEGYGDVVVAYEGRRVPSTVRPGPSPRTFEVWFRLPRALPSGARDASFAIYYGNPACIPSRPADVFDYIEEFADRQAPAMAIDADLQTSIGGGHLVITDVAAGRRESTPARIVLKHVPTDRAFAVAVDLTLEPATDAGFSLSLGIDLKERTVADAKALARLDELIRLFRAEDLEAREQALRDIVAAGRSAVPRLQEALRDEDPEVRSRAESALAQIDAVTPPPTIAATVHRTAGGRLSAATRIGKSRVSYPNCMEPAGRLMLTITRDTDGDVEVAWPGRSPERGTLSGDVREISLRLSKALAGPLGRISIDCIRVYRPIAEDARPRSTFGPEEMRK